MKKPLLSILLLFVASLAFTETVEQKFHFDTPVITLEGDFHTVSITGLTNIGLAGEPALPYQNIKLLLPPGESAAEIEIIKSDRVYLGKGYKLNPAQSSRPLSEGVSGEIVINLDLYSSNNVYPPQAYGELSTHYLNGYAVALSTVTPVEYIPLTGELYYYENITVKLVSKADRKAQDALMNLSSSSLAGSTVASFIQNAAQIKNYPEPGNRTNSYQMLIITSTQLEEGFQELEAMYLQRGIECELVTTEDINLSIAGQDLQEKIRNYIIQEYQENSIEYVLLGGDVEHVPSRGFYCYVQSGSGYEEYNIPSDLYYSALDGNWNDNGDNKWGEIGEDDLLPEVAVARFSVSNSSELENMVQKTIAYQDAPVHGKMRNPLMAGEHLWSDPETWGGDYLDLLIGFHDDNGYESTGIPEDHDINKMYERDSYWYSNDLVDEINAGSSFIHHSGHSNTTYAMKLQTSDISNANFYAVNGVDQNYSLIYTHGCNCGGFDASDCIAEAMVCIDNFAVAGAFNSRYGWFNEGQTEGPSQHLHREFMDALYRQKEGHIGQTHLISKIETSSWVNAPGQHEEGALRWCFYGCNILGDPALCIYTDEPMEIEVDYPDQINQAASSVSASVTSNGSPVEGLVCAIHADGELYGTATTDENGLANIPLNGSLGGTMDPQLTVSGYNCEPHHYPLSIMVNIEEAGDDNASLELFPNPADDLVRLEFSAASGTEVEIRISTFDGREFLLERRHIEKQGTNYLAIDTRKWPQGIYMINIISGNWNASKQLIISH